MATETTPSGTLPDDAQVLAVYADTTRPAAEREDAFRTLVQRYQHRLFAVCRRVLDTSEDAEEAVQETFVRLARSAHTFRGEAQVSTWLYRIARNVCTDRIRHEARRPSTAVEDPDLLTAAPHAEDHLTARETGLVLSQALAQLDDRSRQLLLLVAVDGLSYQEAAELTGLAVGTVKSRVSRARVQLGVLLADDRPDPTSTGPPARPPQPPG